MKKILICALALAAFSSCSTTTTGWRDPASKGGGSKGPSRPEAAPVSRNQAPRSQGTVMGPHPSKAPVQNNAGKDDSHKVIVHNGATGNDESHKVIVDHRPTNVVSHDSHVRVMVRHANFRPAHDWDHFHPVVIGGYQYAWWGVWGVTSWETVGTVTCEASNEATGELYPVTMQRDGSGWDDSTIDNILDQALDDCDAEANVADGAVNPCIAATPSCSFEAWNH